MTSQIKKGEKTKAPSSIKGILNEERHRIVLLRYVKSFFCYFWIYDNVLINSLGIPGGRTKTRKGNSRVSLEGLLSGEQIFSRETKLVVLPRWLLLWCWMAKLLDGRTLPWVAIKRHRYTLIQPFSKKEKTIQEHLLEGIVFEKCKQKPGKPMIEHGCFPFRSFRNHSVWKTNKNVSF